MLDLTNEDEQREGGNGPVPGGSIVFVTMTVLEPKDERRALDNAYVSVSQKGLRQLYCQFRVSKGTYSGVTFRQSITLPKGQQNIAMSSNQEKACNIGGAQLKAICQAARRPLRVNNFQDFTGLDFPVRVKINSKPNESGGRTYWNNEIAMIITPDKEVYDEVRAAGELIQENGPVTGNATATSAQLASGNPDQSLPWDDVPIDAYSEF